MLIVEILPSFPLLFVLISIATTTLTDNLEMNEHILNNRRIYLYLCVLLQLVFTHGNIIIITWAAHYSILDFLKTTHRVVLNIEHLVERFQNFTMIINGEILLGCIFRYNSSKTILYESTIFGVILSLCIHWRCKFHSTSV